MLKVWVKSSIMLYFYKQVLLFYFRCQQMKNDLSGPCRQGVWGRMGRVGRVRPLTLTWTVEERLTPSQKGRAGLHGTAPNS